MALIAAQLESEIKAMLTAELSKKADSDKPSASIDALSSKLSDIITDYIQSAEVFLVGTCTTPQGAFPVVFTVKKLI